ncbi:MAG: S46 family peptidase [Planctomycetota bacterium]
MRRRILAGAPATLAALAACITAPLVAQDELGLGKMWTFDRPPLAYLQREYGFVPDESFFTRMRLASLRFGRGASASFVSPRGLILTNQHCVQEWVTKAQGAHDWLRDGFVAREPGDEVKLPGLEARQLVRTTDVTARIEAGVAGIADANAAEQRRAANREAVLAEARSKEPGLEPQLVKLFQGASWHLYQHKVFADVRLVVLPHLQIAMFGGDPDNFTFPRYAVDFAFCRAWDGDQPVDSSAHWLRWGDGPTEGEVVFLAGNPYGTQRLLTKAQLEFQRDVRYPRMRETIESRLQILRDFAAADEAAAKRLRPSILSFENAIKLFRGEHGALRDAAVMARKEQAEKSFRERAARAGHAGELVVWDRLAALMPGKAALEAPLYLHTAGGLPLLLRALDVVDFAATGDPAKRQRARDSDCGADPVQQALFVDHLRRARAHLPAGDPYLRVMLADQDPAAAATRLLGTSRLCDLKALDALLAAGAAAIAVSDDPALVVARTLAKLIADNKRRSEELEAAESALGARLSRLLFAVYGDDVSPDATGTLRWSDGRVAGYDCNGTRAPWRTVFHGLFARSTEFEGKPPFDLPAEWQQARDRLDLAAPVDFVCTVDSTGGNSGSPVLNRRLELSGLLFDGNIESFANEFLYGERVERSICVHPQAILEALRKVYGAQRVLRELAR